MIHPRERCGHPTKVKLLTIFDSGIGQVEGPGIECQFVPKTSMICRVLR